MEKRTRGRTAAEINFIGLLDWRRGARLSDFREVTQRGQGFVKIGKPVHGVHPGKPDLTRLVDDENSALTGSLERILFPQHAVAPADFSVRPEIAGQQKIEGADLALPGHRIHDVINADAEHFRLPRLKFFPLHLVGNQLLRADRVLVCRIESQNQVAPAPVLREAELRSYTTHQDWGIEVGRHVTGLQQRRSPLTWLVGHSCPTVLLLI